MLPSLSNFPTAIPFAVSAIIAILASRKLFQTLSKFYSLRRLPGPPSPSWLVGHAKELARSPTLKKYNKWVKAYGHAYTLRGPFLETHLIMADPKGLNHVLHGGNYVRPEDGRVALGLFFGRGLFCAEGEEHKRMRKSLHPAFTVQSVKDVSHVFFDLTHRLRAQWDERLDGSDSAVFDITPSLHTLSLDAISMTMFMHDLSATQGKIPDLLHKITNSPGGDMITILLEAFASIFPAILYLPSPMKTWCDRLRSELGVIAAEVWAGKEGGDLHAKVLDALGQQEKSGLPAISTEEAVAQIIGILFAGSETAANTISEGFYELANQPRVQETLRNELLTFEKTYGREPDFDDIVVSTKLPYLEAVTRETLRTKAVLMHISRAAVEDDVIPLHFPVKTTGENFVRVSAGQLVLVPIRDGVNIDADIWGPDAAEYRPERWLEFEETGVPKNVQLLRAQQHLLTFGDGSKVCLGRSFALAEYKIITALTIRRFSFERDESVDLDFYRLGGNTVKPLIRGREGEGVTLPLKVVRLD